MNFLKALNPTGLSNYNPIVSSIGLMGADSITTTPELTAVRDIIGITNSAYDFGLQTALICINSYPELLKETGEENLIGYIASYDRPLITIDSGKILPVGNKFSVNFRPYKIFKNLNLSIEYFDNKKIKLTLDTDIWIVNYHNNNEFLVIDFPEELSSLNFGIELHQSWQEFSKVNIGLAPNGYPFRGVVNNLLESQDFINLINRQGLLDSFLSIPELPYKIALATLAIFKEQISL